MVTTSYAPARQAGNGVILAFNFAYKILASTDLVVSKIDASGNSSGTLILGTDYTVTFDPIAETGTVTYTTAPVNGGFSNIERSSDIEQQTSLPREGPMPAKTVETMIDKLTLIMQELEASQAETPYELQGLYSAKPAAPLIDLYYYSTDMKTYEKWSVNAQRWIQLG